MNQPKVHLSYHPVRAIELETGKEVTILVKLRSFYGTTFQIKEYNKGTKADNIFYPDWLFRQKFKRIKTNEQTQQQDEHNDNIEPIQSGFRG